MKVAVSGHIAKFVCSAVVMEAVNRESPLSGICVFLGSQNEIIGGSD